MKRKVILFLWLLVIAIAVMIFLFSAQDGAASSRTSGFFTNWLIHLLYPDYDAWRADNPGRMIYPFMLDASLPLPEVLRGKVPPDWVLAFGNEGSGLPAFWSQVGQAVRIPSNDRVDSLNLSVAAAVGIYAFAGRTGLLGAPAT